MNKKDNLPNPWDSEQPTVDSTVTAAPVEQTRPVKPRATVNTATRQSTGDFDIDGLMSDFPTAKDLERFVYDETGVVLNLKGRANKLKYQVAMDVLNGQAIEDKFLGNENPYVDKAEMIPQEDLKAVPARDTNLPPRSQLQNSFYSPFIPHPNDDFRAQDKKVSCLFRKYKNGVVSYEVLGPLDTVPVGEKIDKFGRTRPEYIKWIDPRTGEQLMVRADGSLTPMGRNLRGIMQKFRVNKSNAWEVWIDREFAALQGGSLKNPWDLTGNE